MTDDEAERTLALASEVTAALRARRVKTAVVGAGAMAVHIPEAGQRPPTARLPGRDGRAGRPGPARGSAHHFPRGRGSGADRQFDNSAFSAEHPRLGRLAVTTAESHPDLPAPLRVAQLPVLIALKLYAGGPKSELDVLELLDRNRPVDLESLRTLCAGLGLGDRLDALLARMH